MGLTHTHRPKGYSTKEFLQKEFGGKTKIIDCAMSGSTAYLAVIHDNSKHVECIVVLTSRKSKDYHNFSYKVIHETEIPSYYDCPERIFKLLTPVDIAYAKYSVETRNRAHEWRQKARLGAEAKSKLKLKTGVKLKFKNGIRFKDGRSPLELICVNARRLQFYDPVNPGVNYKPERRVLEDAYREGDMEIVQP